MNYHIFKLISLYLDITDYIFYALVCKDWKEIINLIRKDNKYNTKYKTKYNVLTSLSLLCYSEKLLNLVYNEKVNETIIKIGDLDSIKYLYTKTDIIDSEYLNDAAKSGHLASMKWLKDNGCPNSY